MSKPRYNLLLRLRSCWRLLTAKSWLFYTPEPHANKISPFRVSWQGLTTGDTANVRFWADTEESDVRAAQQLVDGLLTLNPGIGPAPDA